MDFLRCKATFISTKIIQSNNWLGYRLRFKRFSGECGPSGKLNPFLSNPEGVPLVVGSERRLNSFYATCFFNEV